MKKESYKNNSGKSGIKAFSIGRDYIDVNFSDGKPYRYSYESAGEEHVKAMKKLARLGQGFNAYLNKYVWDKFEKEVMA